MLFCGRIGMHVILRPDWNACYFAAFSECMLFCGLLGMHVILRPALRSKFILRPALRSKFILRHALRSKFILRPALRSKFILRFDFLDITVRHEIGKRYKSKRGIFTSRDARQKRRTAVRLYTLANRLKYHRFTVLNL